MKYFYIFGNICSILSFLAAILVLPENTEILISAQWFILLLILLTILFWLFFYLKPQNPIANIIDSRINFTGEYSDTQNQTQDIIEGVFDVNTSNWGTRVMLPPFEDKPNIRILYCTYGDGGDTPLIEEVTADYFKVKINSSTQTGTWKWRARGKLLKVQSQEQ